VQNEKSYSGQTKEAKWPHVPASRQFDMPALESEPAFLSQAGVVTSFEYSVNNNQQNLYYL